jgi:glycosyltransferase involved in cell wall biosynthesis
LTWATRLVVLQKQGLFELPEHLQAKTEVIYQSAKKVKAKNNIFPTTSFNVLVVANLRVEKDPFRTVLALSKLPEYSKIQVFHIGLPLNQEMEEELKFIQENTTRYHWLGSLPHNKTKQYIAAADLVSITSRIEGGSNVLCESLAAGTSVITTNIPSLVATLGDNYPGYFSVGDTKNLANLLWQAENDINFYQELKNNCKKVAYLVDPATEEKCWQDLIKQLSEC